MRDAYPILTLGDYSKPSHEGYKNNIDLPVGNNVVPLRSDTIRLVQNECSFHRLRSEDPNQHLKDFLKLMDSLDLDGENMERTRTIDQSVSGKLRDRNTKESWALLEDLALYDNKSWNDSRDFAKPVKSVSLPQDDPMNKITSSCEICSGPHDTQYCMENPEQAFVEYTYSRTDEAGGALPIDTVKNPKLNVNPTTSVLSIRSYPTEDPRCSTHIHGSINAITIHPKQQSDSRDDEPEENMEEEKSNREDINTNPSTPPDPSVSFITKKIVKKDDDSRKEEPEVGGLEAYIDLNSPQNIMTRMMYNWIMRRKLDPRENSDRGVSNFTGRIKGMHVFVGNFTYVTDFMIVEDISSIIDPRLSQVVLGKPFIKISNMTHDPPKGVVRIINGTDEIDYKMPHKIEQYNSLSDFEKEHTKSVYLRNEEDKKRGVEYVMNKILGFYKECLELRPEYVTRIDDEGEVTKFLIKNKEEISTVSGDGVGIKT
ncbi:hypothetical protein Tco_0679520 [Tanacetum coccineum]|uniref:MAK10-like protein n=1 Tax=Tanacetum coccineum TaxID=301880 RepID=A0ABQ4XI82_9ASTR